MTSAELHRRGINPAEAPPDVYAETLARAEREVTEDHQRVVAAGGLHIIGTERHDARRIDNQLRGRAGRQGDPGSSRFYLSLDDTLLKRFANDRVAGLMERMGLHDGAAIESRLVSKTIENAQTRVEGYNFDIRKRVVEYDDVINKQRETIYAERDKVLRNEDLTQTIAGFLDEELDTIVDTRLFGDQIDEWDFDGLAADLHGLGLHGDDFSADLLAEFGTRDEVTEHLRDAVDRDLGAREEEHGPEVWAQVERFVLLRTIDSLWVDHLTELDDLRRGVGLRGYGGIDPLNEFKKEAFRLYEELRGFIRHQVASTIFRVSVEPAVQQQTVTSTDSGGSFTSADGASDGSGDGSGNGRAEPTAAGPARALPGLAAAAGTRRGGLQYQHGDQPVAGEAAGRSTAPDGRKLGRNDLCWCGSGKKFKRCHGA